MPKKTVCTVGSTALPTGLLSVFAGARQRVFRARLGVLDYGRLFPFLPPVREFWNTKDFWTVRVVMASKIESYYDFFGQGEDSSPYGLFAKGDNTIFIFYEKLKADYPDWNDLQISIQRTLLHEIGHVLLKGTDDDHNKPGGVMSVHDRLKPENLKFLLEDIKEIQENSRARN